MDIKGCGDDFQYEKTDSSDYVRILIVFTCSTIPKGMHPLLPTHFPTKIYLNKISLLSKLFIHLQSV